MTTGPGGHAADYTEMERMFGIILFRRLQEAMADPEKKLTASEMDKIERHIMRMKPPKDPETEFSKGLKRLAQAGIGGRLPDVEVED